MGMETIYDATTKRQRIKQDQKVWKFVRDTNSIALDDLNKTAVIDGIRQYTYGQMFHEWDRYAAVFSALGMTGQNHARVGILGSPSAQVIFSFYGLNMVGAEVSVVPSYFALMLNRVMVTIRDEKLTDFIITDDFAQGNLVGTLLAKREELGLRNVIVLHVPIAGETALPVLTSAQEIKYRYLKGVFGPICMDELLKSYETFPVSYAPNESADIAIILHTSGTTSGMGNPVALSDKAFNAAAASFYKMKNLALPFDNLVTAVIVELSNVYSMIDQVHLPFAVGAGVVLVPMGILNPTFHKAIPAHGISFLFTVGAMFERWMKMPEAEQKSLDFSSLRFVALGGSFVSARDKKRYHAFLMEHGGSEDITILNGYGLSELGGVCCLSTPDLDDEAIGYALPGVTIRLYDEEKEQFLSEKNLPAEGVLYLTSPALATSTLDGKEILKTEMIGRKPYYCTNDYVRVEADGKIIFLGRANRFFLYEEGKKYASGRVETEFSRQMGIEGCGIVPVYIKTTHDNIPMLCVKTLEAVTDDAKKIVIDGLMGVFTGENALDAGNVPYRVMLLDELPRNRNGKVDLFKISRGEVEGDVYTVETQKDGETITGFSLVPYEEGKADMIREVLQGISADIQESVSLTTRGKDGKMETPCEVVKDRTKEGIQTMNHMGRQMVNNRMWQMFPGRGPAVFPFFGRFVGQQKKEQPVNENEKHKTMEVPKMFFMGNAMENFNEMHRKGFERMGNMMGQMQKCAPPCPMPFFGMPFCQQAAGQAEKDDSKKAAPEQGKADGQQEMQKMFMDMMNPMKMFENMPNMKDVFEGMQKMMADLPKVPQLPDPQKMFENIEKMFPNTPYKQKMIENLQKAYADMQKAQKMFEESQKMWADLMNPQKMQENMQKVQEDMQKAWTDLMNPQKMQENMQKAWTDMMNPQKMQENMQKAWADMMNPQKMQENMQKAWADMMNPQKMQENMQKAWADLMNPQKMFEDMQKAFANAPSPMQAFAGMWNQQAPQQSFAAVWNWPMPWDESSPMQSMISAMQARMNQMFENMSQMNQSMISMMKTVFEQNNKMMEKFIAAVQPAAPKADEDAEAEPEQAPAEEEVPVEVIPAEDVTVEEAPVEEAPAETEQEG